MDKAVGDVIEEGIKLCDGGEDFLDVHYYVRSAVKITSSFGLALPGDSARLYQSDRSRFTTPERSDDNNDPPTKILTKDVFGF
jgi:hypothetical protein